MIVAALGGLLIGGLFGFPGPDAITSRDGVSGNDMVDGMQGYDACRIDPGDTTASCEV